MRPQQVVGQHALATVALDRRGRTEVGRGLLERGEVIVVVEQEVVDLVGRGDRTRLGVRLVEERGEGLREVGQARAFGTDDRDEALALRRFEVLDGLQDFR